MDSGPIYRHLRREKEVSSYSRTKLSLLSLFLGIVCLDASDRPHEIIPNVERIEPSQKIEQYKSPYNPNPFRKNYPPWHIDNRSA